MWTPGQATRNPRTAWCGTPGVLAWRRWGRAGFAEDEDVFVGDEVEGDALAAGVAGVLELEEGGVEDQVVVADAGQECGAALDGEESGVAAGGEDGGGEVDEFAAFAPGA